MTFRLWRCLNGCSRAGTEMWRASLALPPQHAHIGSLAAFVRLPRIALSAFRAATRCATPPAGDRSAWEAKDTTSPNLPPRSRHLSRLRSISRLTLRLDREGHFGVSPPWPAFLLRAVRAQPQACAVPLPRGVLKCVPAACVQNNQRPSTPRRRDSAGAGASSRAPLRGSSSPTPPR